MMKRFDVLYITLGALYLLAGMIMGLVMAMRHDFTLGLVHSHFNLVGLAVAILHDGFFLVAVGSMIIIVGALPVVRNGLAQPVRERIRLNIFTFPMKA